MTTYKVDKLSYVQRYHQYGEAKTSAKQLQKNEDKKL